MKKKIVALCLVICMLAIAVVGGTLAYFTDTKTVENTFTAGKIEIKLDEAKVKKDASGNLAADGDERISGKAISTEAPINQSYHLFPAMTITKDPTITVVANSEDAYVAAIVTIQGKDDVTKGTLEKLIGMTGVAGYLDLNKEFDGKKFVSGGLLAEVATAKAEAWNELTPVFENSKAIIYQDATEAANNTWTLYIFMKDIQPKKDTDAKIVLFEELQIPAAWDNAEMDLVSGMKINVKAYATQANGFTDVYNAITTAFATDFAAVK